MFQNLINFNINSFFEYDSTIKFSSKDPNSIRIFKSAANKSSRMIILPSKEKISLKNLILNSIDNDDENKKKFDIKILNSDNFKKHALKLSKSGVLFPICCLGRDSLVRKQLTEYFKFKQIIDNQMDVLNIIEKINIIDKINFLLLGEKNKYLLQNCFNPLILKNEICQNLKIIKINTSIIF